MSCLNKKNSWIDVQMYWLKTIKRVVFCQQYFYIETMNNLAIVNEYKIFCNKLFKIYNFTSLSYTTKKFTSEQEKITSVFHFNFIMNRQIFSSFHMFDVFSHLNKWNIHLFLHYLCMINDNFTSDANQLSMLIRNDTCVYDCVCRKSFWVVNN